MNYIGEHLLAGKLGNAFVILSFSFALLSAISYFCSSKNYLENDPWRRIARLSFRLHSLSVFCIVATLFYMLLNHYFEYEYVWHHSNKAMPMRYIFSCFWEGQEGSFLLWTFWHTVIGNILMRTAKDWEAPVMTVVSSVQVFLASMLLGVYIFDYKIGSNPFTMLLRETPDFMNIPLFKNPNYLEKLDGRGLNPLLQNYWMTIHPPTLFLGFALTLVPFAYAIAGLWKEKFNEWQKPVLHWAFVGIMVLGTGILMGGAWAYEALSFGGFWAWDPVENASLVPWLTLVGAAHVMLINKHNGQSLVFSFFLATITFILILYSTFLTRSGILGDSSVHAFTDLGMSGQLLIYLFSFLLLATILLIVKWKKIPKQLEEEGVWSREFWMFVGALVLLISSFHIMFNTSLPVWNKLFNLKMAPPANVIQYYNSWQIPFAFLVTLLIGVGQFFKYKKTDIKEFGKKIILSVIIALVLTILIAIGLSLTNYFYCLLLFSSLFAIIANADYLIGLLKGKVTKAGSSIAHIGFGLVLLGALISTSKQQTISVNNSGRDIENLDKGLANNKNILLMTKDTVQMGNYYVTYKGKRKQGVNVYFEVEYFTKDEAGKYQPAFVLNPLVQMNERMGNVAEPDTRHFLTNDVYTHVTYADLETLEEKRSSEEYAQSKNHPISVGDTIFSSNSIIILEGLNTQLDKQRFNLSKSDILVGAKFKLIDVSGKAYFAQPVYAIRKNIVEPVEAVANELGLKLLFWKIDPATGKVEITISEKKSNARDFIVMQAIVFPYINILWTGCIVMIIGTLIAVWQRVKNTGSFYQR